MRNGNSPLKQLETLVLDKDTRASIAKLINRDISHPKSKDLFRRVEEVINYDEDRYFLEHTTAWTEELKQLRKVRDVLSEAYDSINKLDDGVHRLACISLNHSSEFEVFLRKAFPGHRFVRDSTKPNSTFNNTGILMGAILAAKKTFTDIVKERSKGGRPKERLRSRIINLTTQLFDSCHGWTEEEQRSGKFMRERKQFVKIVLEVGSEKGTRYDPPKANKLSGMMPAISSRGNL